MRPSPPALRPRRCLSRMDHIEYTVIVASGRLLSRRAQIALSVLVWSTSSAMQRCSEERRAISAAGDNFPTARLRDGAARMARNSTTRLDGVEPKLRRHGVGEGLGAATHRGPFLLRP